MISINSTLYRGANARNQTIYTWLANATLPSLDDMDIAPLLAYLVHPLGFVAKDLYLGSVQFGCETLYATNQLNFSVASFEADMAVAAGDGTGTPLPTATRIAARDVVTSGAAGRSMGPTDWGSGWALVMPLWLALFWGLWW